MAFYLDIPPSANISLDTGQVFHTTTSNSFEIELTFSASTASSDIRLFSFDGGNNGNGEFSIKENGVSFGRRIGGGSSVSLPCVIPFDGSVNTLRIVCRAANEYEAFLNGAPVSTSTSSQSGGNVLLSYISSDAIGGGWSLYSLTFRDSENGNLLNNYDPSASGGTGQILPDTVGGNDGTLFGFPTDSSQWKFYYDPQIDRIDPLQFYLNGDNQPAPVVVPYAYTPTQATQGQTLVLTESVLEKMPQAQQDVFWNNVDLLGGDLRLTSNQDGTGRLPVEIVSIDTAARKLVLWYRLFEDFDGIGNAYLWFGKAGETQPAVTDPFGRNAVWVDYFRKWDEDYNEFIGGSSVVETPPIGGKVQGKIHVARDYNSDGYVKITPFTVGAGKSISFWYYPRSSGNSSFGSVFGSSSYSHGVRHLGDNKLNLRISDQVVASSGFLLYNNWYKITLDNDGIQWTMRIDGVASVNVETWSTPLNVENLISIASHPSRAIDGLIEAPEIGVNRNESYRQTEYANQNDPATFYGTPTIQAAGGGGAVEQPVVSVNAEELHHANTLSISAFNSISSVIAEQIESANLIDVFLSQLASSIQAQERHDATAMNIEQSASQSVNSLTAEQIEQANLVDISQSLMVNSVQAQENQQANTLTVEQSAGQSITLNIAQQVEQATVLSLAQQQALAHIVAEQLSAAGVTDVTNLQAVTMIIAEESHQANALNVEQYTGQFVTLITAEQKSEAQTLLISEVSAIDVLQAEQVTNAETMAFSQVQRLTQITAEQLTEAQLLTILTSGDNTDLSGLRLIPITSKYTINPTNTTQYSLQKV